MSIENIDLLIKNLQHIKKQLIEQNTLHPIDKDLLKKQLLAFYENEFFTYDSSINHETINNISENSSASKLTTNTSSNNQVETIIENKIIEEVKEPTPIIEKIADEPKISAQETLISSIIPIADKEVIENNSTTNNDFSSLPLENAKTVVITETTKGFNDMISTAPSSLNERFQSNTSVADKIKSQNKSMNELIDLNKKLLFVDVLFNGNNQLFSQVIQHIDEYKSAKEAIQFIEFNKSKLQITEKKESVYQTFLELINKKFNS